MEIKKIDLDENASASDSKKPLSFKAESAKAKKPVNTDPPKSNMSKQNLIPVVIFFVVAAVAGVLSGGLIKSRVAASNSEKAGVTANIQAEVPQSGVKVGDVYGSANETIFKDKVLGVLEKGGIGGEGTHKLIRPGGSTQTVCLSSTTIDLDQLVGDQVTLWGETYSGQKCGWLMDVGRARVENLNVPVPTE